MQAGRRHLRDFCRWAVAWKAHGTNGMRMLVLRRSPLSKGRVLRRLVGAATHSGLRRTFDFAGRAHHLCILHCCPCAEVMLVQSARARTLLTTTIHFKPHENRMRIAWRAALHLYILTARLPIISPNIRNRHDCTFFFCFKVSRRP